MVPHIDISAFPIVLFTFGSSITHAEIDEHQRNVIKLAKERGGIIGVVDTRAVLLDVFRAPLRRHMARRADELAQMGAIIAEFVVMNSSLARSFFVIYAHLRRSRRHPMFCFGDLDKAYAAAELCARRLAKAGALPKVELAELRPG